MNIKIADYELFKKECEKWIGILGLYSWERSFAMNELQGSYARVEWDLDGRNCRFTLANEFPEELSVEDKEARIKITALHEVLELLLAPMQEMAQKREWDKNKFGEEVHLVIRILEDILKLQRVQAEILLTKRYKLKGGETK